MITSPDRIKTHSGGQHRTWQALLETQGLLAIDRTLALPLEVFTE